MNGSTNINARRETYLEFISSSGNKEYLKAEEAILQAFFTLLEDFSFDQITVSQIIDTANINRSTFYRHYQDKYDILEKIQKSALPVTNKMLHSFFGSSKNLFDILFHTSYLEEHFPEEYKKYFFQLMQIQTANFNLQKMIHDGFMHAYIPSESSPSPQLEKELFADIAFRMLIYRLSDASPKLLDGGQKVLRSLMEQLEKTLDD